MMAIFGDFSQQKPFFSQQKGQKRVTFSEIKCLKSHDGVLYVFLTNGGFVLIIK